jgi:hypothetical protein
VECHRPGQVAPFSLLTFAGAAKRAAFIAKVTKSHFMPPWLPDAPRDAFFHERRLSDEEIATIAAWSEAGAPQGDLSLAPTPPAAPPDGWRLGTPDLVVRMRQPFPIPAGPNDVYEVFPISFSLKDVPPSVIETARIPETDILGVAAVEIHFGNRRVVHHANVWVDTSGIALKKEAASGGNGYPIFGSLNFPATLLGAQVLGTVPEFLPDGIATEMPMKSDLVLQIHYHPTGKPEIDQSEIGIYFVRQPTKRVTDRISLGYLNIEIPTGARDHEVDDQIEVPTDCYLLSVAPHMHLIGREIHASVLFPDGSRKSLLDITHWDFNWSDKYVYKEPIFLPRGTKVFCRWIYDNTEANPHNPNSPPQHVSFGPNSTDEMAEFHLEVIPVNMDAYPLFPELRRQHFRNQVLALTPEQVRRYTTPH